MKNYWAHDGTEIDWYGTEEEAKAAAQTALDAYQDVAVDGWGEGVDLVSWGTVIGRAVEYGTRDAEEGSGLDFVSDYELRLAGEGK